MRMFSKVVASSVLATMTVTAAHAQHRDLRALDRFAQSVAQQATGDTLHHHLGNYPGALAHVSFMPSHNLGDMRSLSIVDRVDTGAELRYGQMRSPLDVFNGDTVRVDVPPGRNGRPMPVTFGSDGRVASVTVAGSRFVRRDERVPIPTPTLWANLTPGPHRVGYRTRFAGSVDVWYPTRARGTPLRYGDYVGNRASALKAFLTQNGVTDGTADSLLGLSLYAIANAAPAEAAWPVVLIAQGNGHDAPDQVVLCEYLASHGFVVVTTPSPTLRTPLVREDQVGAIAELQANDLLDALRAVAPAISIDTLRIGVVGHSFGARAALLVAMRNRNVRAFASLDGGIGTTTAITPLRTAPSFDSLAVLPPLLHFYENLDAFMTPDFSFIRSLRFADVTLAPTEGMHHVHFTTYGPAAAALPGIAAATRATEVTAGNVRKVYTATADFLRRVVR